MSHYEMEIKEAEPVGKLSPQPWMHTAAVQGVMDAFDVAGAEFRFVGGCVRDAVAKRPVKDVDIATPEVPERVMEILANAGLKPLPIGIDHGTVSVVVDGEMVEITTLRRDVESHGRHATVAFTDSWSEDAARRDFTINAMSCTEEGDIYDFFDGLDDLARGRVRFVGRAVDRIDEDVLRLLRFFRFFAHYGRPPPDEAAITACRLKASRLPELSGERVRDELFKILLAPDPAGVLSYMRMVGALEQLLPEAGSLGVVKSLAWLETNAVKIDGVTPDALRRLAALLKTDDPGLDTVADRLKLSNKQRDRLHEAFAHREMIAPDLTEDDRRRLLHRLGGEAVRDGALLTWAGALAVEAKLPRLVTDGWIGLLEQAAAWVEVDFPLRGRDAKKLGLAPGQGMGRMLKAIQAWWEDGGCRADYEACFAEMKRRVEENPE